MYSADTQRLLDERPRRRQALEEIPPIRRADSRGLGLAHPRVRHERQDCVDDLGRQQVRQPLVLFLESRRETQKDMILNRLECGPGTGAVLVPGRIRGD